MLKDRFFLPKNCQTICCPSIILQLSWLEFDLKGVLFHTLRPTEILLTEIFAPKRKHTFVNQISNYQNLGYLLYVGDSTTQFYRDYNKPV